MHNMSEPLNEILVELIASIHDQERVQECLLEIERFAEEYQKRMPGSQKEKFQKIPIDSALLNDVYNQLHDLSEKIPEYEEYIKRLSEVVKVSKPKKLTLAVHRPTDIIPANQEWENVRQLLKSSYANQGVGFKISKKDHSAQLKHSYLYVNDESGSPKLYRVGNIVGKGMQGKLKMLIDEDGKQWVVKITEEKPDRSQIQIMSNIGYAKGDFVRKKEKKMSKTMGKEIGNKQYVITKYIEGKTLSTTSLTVDNRLTAASLIANSLKELHGKNVIHLDVKPDNILVQVASGEVQSANMIDFDTSIQTNDDGRVIANPQGSPLYMAPELGGPNILELNKPLNDPKNGIQYKIYVTQQRLLNRLSFAIPKNPKERETATEKAIQELSGKLAETDQEIAELLKLYEELKAQRDALMAEINPQVREIFNTPVEMMLAADIYSLGKTFERDLKLELNSLGLSNMLAIDPRDRPDINTVCRMLEKARAVAEYKEKEIDVPFEQMAHFNEWKNSIDRYEIGSNHLGLLSEEGKKILYRNIEPNKTTARETFLRYLSNLLQYGTPTDTINEKTTTLELFLGKQGLELYREAIAEEKASPAFREAVFNSATKEYAGPAWDSRLVLWVGGPSGVGKTKGTERAVNKMIASGILPTRDIANKNSVNPLVAIDGGIEREVSQMRQMVLQVVLSKGYKGISGIDKESKFGLKKTIKAAALATDNLSIVIPNTFTSNLFKSKKEIDQFEKDENVFQAFSVVEPPSERKQDVEQLRETVALMGDARAWYNKPERFSENSIKMNNRRIGCESKKYNPDYFTAGRICSGMAKDHFLKNPHAAKRCFIIVNDLQYFTKDPSGKYVPYVKEIHGDSPKVLTRKGIIDAWENMHQRGWKEELEKMLRSLAKSQNKTVNDFPSIEELEGMTQEEWFKFCYENEIHGASIRQLESASSSISNEAIGKYIGKNDIRDIAHILMNRMSEEERVQFRRFPEVVMLGALAKNIAVLRDVLHTDSIQVNEIDRKSLDQLKREMLDISHKLQSTWRKGSTIQYQKSGSGGERSPREQDSSSFSPARSSSYSSSSSESTSENSSKKEKHMKKPKK